MSLLPDTTALSAPETVMTAAEVAKMLRVAERTVREMAHRGEIPARQVGRQWRFSAIQLHRWLGPEREGGDPRGQVVAGRSRADIEEWASRKIAQYRPVFEELARR